jgi:site-specific recombinase
VGRIVLSTVRQEKIWFWGLQEAQVLGIVVLVVSAVLAVYLTRRSRGATAEIAVPVPHQSQSDSPHTLNSFPMTGKDGEPSADMTRSTAS